MKRKFSVIFILTAFMLIISFYIKPRTAFALDTGLNFQSESVYLCESESGSEIYSKNADKRLPIASMCKIMTALLTFEAIDNGFTTLNDIITVSENASGMGGSQVFLEENGKYKVSDLIKSVIVASANDASVALAEHIGGSEKQFVDLMNEKAQKLGMNNTLFVNCTGLPKPTQYSSAKDVAKMFNELIKHKEYFIFSKIWMDEITHPEGRITGISNTNKLVKFYNGCDSGKTGYTQEAGHCVCASAVKDNMRLISVVIKAPNSQTRFKEASSLFNYGFSNYASKLIVDKDKPLAETVKVLGGKVESITVRPEKSLFIFGEKNKKIGVEFVFRPDKSIKAPVNEGDKVGVLYVFDNNGKEINSVNIVSNEKVDRAGYFDSIQKITNNWGI